MTSVSVVIPVKDGGPLLARALAAAAAQGPEELLVIDSGSRDGSQDVARAAGVELIEIAPEEFGHGRTRNLAAERTRGTLIAFLTQDAVPLEGWLDALRASFELDDRVGATYGPHLPRADTSPMIARELNEFFAGFAPDGRPVVQRAGDPTFLSNVNACYARACWEEIRFADVAYSEDQTFGQALLAAGWTKVYNPAAAVEHAHDYGPVEFMKRYFDEYRGLREASGHVEPLNPLEAPRQVVRDAHWMRAQGLPAGTRARWIGRSAVHHGGRRVASALGSRADALPGRIQQSLSLEGRRGGASAAAPQDAPDATAGLRIDPLPPPGPHEEILRVSKEGPAPLSAPVKGMADRSPLHLAVVIPPFSRGSGGHNTIFTLISRLERMGHTCTIWMYDPLQRHYESASVLRRRIVEEFLPVEAPTFKGFDDWHGADVVVATGWDTAYQAALLPHCRARAYLINDHEAEFYATSAESLWAAQTYELGFYGISASRWLRDLLARQYGQRGDWFRLGVDRTIYRPQPLSRRRDTVLFYGRGYTARRAVPLGILALDELVRRRPDVRVAIFGQDENLEIQVPHDLLGIVSPRDLARAYSEATVGLCLSLTNYSLIPQEMLACGLPCVDIGGASTEAELGREAGVEYADADPVALADALERLLVDEQHWQAASEAGTRWTERASWDAAARQVETALREALRERERSLDATTI